MAGTMGGSEGRVSGGRGEGSAWRPALRARARRRGSAGELMAAAPAVPGGASQASLSDEESELEDWSAEVVASELRRCQVLVGSMGRGVVYLGSSRVRETHPFYTQAMELSSQVGEEGGNGGETSSTRRGSRFSCDLGAASRAVCGGRLARAGAQGNGTAQGRSGSA